MTPAELLAPQPAPVRTERSQSVTDWLLSGESTAEIEDLIRARRAQGVERYGQELTTYNGRSALCDALQECVDLVLYLAQAEMEADLVTRDLDIAMTLLHRLVERAK